MIKTSVNTGQTLILVAASALLLASAPLRASETDDRIESSAKKSYVFKTYLKDDAIKTESKNGAVTLTGTVAEDSHKSPGREHRGRVCPASTAWTTNSRSKVKAPPNIRMAGSSTKVKTTLLFHRNVSATKTDVYVKDGIVSLRGEASSHGAKGTDHRIRQRRRRRQRG